SSIWPWNGSWYENLRSLPDSVPSNGSSPIWVLKRPFTFSPSCVSVTLTLLVPCGDVSDTSQSPVTDDWANAGDPVNSASEATTIPARIMRTLLLIPYGFLLTRRALREPSPTLPSRAVPSMYSPVTVPFIVICIGSPCSGTTQLTVI